MKRELSAAFLVCVMVTLSGCAKHYASGVGNDPYGFLFGIWHGVVWPLAVVVNLVSWALSIVGISFLREIELIGRPNTGFWYYVGFALGLLAWTGSSGRR
jgi:hypothetical protein